MLKGQYSYNGYKSLFCILVLLSINHHTSTFADGALIDVLNDLVFGVTHTTSRKCIDWVDSDTPKKSRQVRSRSSGQMMNLVFSDEFESQDRDFSTLDSDSRWSATNIYSWLTEDNEVYRPEMIKMNHGSARITLSQTRTCYNAPSGNQICRPFRGGQITTWNKFCFTGGRIEFRVRLPGAATMPGYWPALWLLGNLGRAGYGATLDGTFPYGYDHCDPGVYPTNSTINKASSSCMRGQRVNKCNTKDDAPWGMNRNQGRGAPEIDILEISPGSHGVLVSSYQISPKEPFYFDGTGFYPYKMNANGYSVKPNCRSNDWAGSHVQDAVSAIYPLNGTHWEGWHVFGVEWYPSQNLTFFLDEDMFFTLNMESLKGKEGLKEEGYPDYISQRLVSEEATYILMNLATSSGFSPVGENSKFPVHFDIDYVRVYQPPDAIRVGCSPKRFPTKKYIDHHWEYYTNPSHCCYDNQCHFCRGVGSWTLPSICYESSYSMYSPKNLTPLEGSDREKIMPLCNSHTTPHEDDVRGGTIAGIFIVIILGLIFMMG